MKKRLLVFFALAILAGLAGAACQKQHYDIASLKYPPLEFKPPRTRRVVLSNGMILHLLENHELPIVEIDSMVRIGSAWEPVEKRGLASLTGSVWRSGGTESVSPDELDARIEFIGASIETSIGEKSGSIGMSVLKKDIDEGLVLFADLVKNPRFDEKRFTVAKNRKLEGIKRENDDPQVIARREFKRLLFSGHIYGVPPTIKSVSRITRRDCVRFYRDHVGPKSFLIGITGDFDSEDIIARFEKLFADFKTAPKKLPPIPELPTIVNPGVWVVNKELPQAVIRGGHFGINRKNPDYYAVRVMNYVLGGGGFSSRLLKEIRSTRGLAYSVWSYFSGGFDDRGTFLTGGETRAQSTYEFLNEVRLIMDDIIENGVTEDELIQAREAIVNSFVHAFDKDSKIVAHYLRLEYFDMPKDYLEKFRDRINEVTFDKAKEAANRYLHPHEMIIVVVGDRKTMGKEIERLGKVREIKIKE